MIAHSRRERLLAIALASLAGYVDALAFMELGGYFVSFMSGNTTRLGTGIAQSFSLALVPAGLVGLFVAGVIVGSLVAHVAGRRRASVTLYVVAVLLLAGAGSSALGSAWAAIIAMAIAMGAANAVFQRNGEVSIGVTYMTGALVKMGQRITSAILGGDRLAWFWYFALWIGLASGAALGAYVYRAIGLDALWFAGGSAAVLALAARFLVDGDQPA